MYPGSAGKTPAARTAAADRGKRGHRQSDHDIDLVGLLVLGNAPAPRRLRSDGAADGKAKGGVWVGNQIVALDEFKQILRGLGQIGDCLRKLLQL